MTTTITDNDTHSFALHKDHSKTDPLLKSSEDRYVMFPIQYDDVWKMYKKQIDCFWRAEEVDLSKDLADWGTLTEDEKHFISMVLAFFAASDGIVLENLAVRFMTDIQVSEARAFYGFQIAMENIHSEMYSILIDTFIQNTEQRRRLFQATQNFPCIGEKAKWAQKWMNDKSSNFATRLLGFACVEGIFFSSSFASIYWIKKRGLMPGLTFSNELISRDEALHTEFAILIYSKLKEKLSQEQVHAIIRESVEIEKYFITESLPCRLIGMNAKLMKQYIEFVGDRLSLQLGYDKIYGASNPFEFMELISVDTKVNFFERTNSAYALANKNVNDNVFDFTALF
jgi:ribonucleoside-diphosphate reductase subunit M2